METHPQSQETAIQLPDAKYILILEAIHSCYSYKTKIDYIQIPNVLLIMKFHFFIQTLLAVVFFPAE